VRENVGESAAMKHRATGDFSYHFHNQAAALVPAEKIGGISTLLQKSQLWTLATQPT
jgi:hypothetical protein